jgi:hypothetical protein
MERQTQEITLAVALQTLMRRGRIDGMDAMLYAERVAVEREELPEVGYTRFKFEDGSEIFL